MKTRNIILLALAALLTVSCHSWDEPPATDNSNHYGNQYLQETNVVTVADLKAQFKSAISDGSYKQVTKATQIKVIVTGNDEGSNIYKKLYVADATGGIYIAINKGGIYTEAAVGQCMLIELEGLYVGGYGQQPEIGVTYDDEGTTKMGRMSRYTWQEHYKLIPAVPGLSAKPVVTNDIGAFDIDKDFGRVITLVGVTVADADGKMVFAPEGASETNREIANQSSTVYIRTNSYAKFANMTVPTGRFNITGIASRYGNEWQIYARTVSDIQPYTGNEVLDVEIKYTPVAAEGDGTAANPFNVTAAIEKCKEIGSTASTQKYYVKGYVAKDAEASAQHGNITFDMKASKEGGKTFTAYQMAGSDGKKLPAGFKVSQGDEVVVYGAIYNYSGNKPETEGQGKAIIVSVNGKKTDGTDPSVKPDEPEVPGGDGNVTVSKDGAVLTLVNNDVTASANTVTVDLSTQGWSNEESVTTLTLADGTTLTFSQNDGNNAPKYYNSGTAVRMYAKNSLAITGSNKAIAKVVLTCASATYTGNATLYGSATGSALYIVNEHTGTSGGTQLRVKSIDITYAQ